MSLENAEWRREVEGAVEFLSLIDGDRLIYVNHAQASIEDYAGRSVFEFISPEYHGLARRSMEAARRTGYPQHYESEAAGPGGETSFYSNWIFQVTNPTSPGVLAFVATDITAIRRMQDELERTDVTLRSVVDQAPDQIMIVDRERRLLFVNRFELGYDSTAVMGQPIENFVTPDDRDLVVAAIESVIRTGERTSFETVVNAPTGDYVFSTRAGPIMVDGRVDSVVMVSTDITSRIEAERERDQLNAQLQHSQKLDALGQLTGGVAHDFNNLLTAIAGNLELVRHDLGSDEASSGYLAQALRAVDQAADLTRRLLVFARRQPLVARTEQIDHLISEMAPLLVRTLGETIEVRVASGDDLWPCKIDRGQLEQALLNLAVNGRDAMPAGGTLEITSANFTAAAGPPGQPPAGDYVSVSVRDTGFGMDADIAEQAFEPFFTTKDPERGTGLGLSMVYGFASQSGGHVTLDSQPGVGTTVQLLLPRAPATESEPATAEQPVLRRGSGQVVLVVEDQPMVRQVCVELLGELGYGTREAAHAEEALAALATHDDIALILSDLGLPGPTDGLELARRVRKGEPPLPVVLMSGYADTTADDGDLPDGMRFLPKPFGQTEVADTIADALE